MKVYVDIASNEELFSAAHPITLLHDVVYKVEGKFVIELNNINEPTSEDIEDTAVRVINIVKKYRLHEISLSKKDFLTYIKKYSAILLKRFKESVKDSNDYLAQLKRFQINLNNFIKDILIRFNEFVFYIRENSYDVDESMMIVSDFSPDGLTPFFYFFKHGVSEMNQTPSFN